MLPQTIVNGLLFGSVYATIGIGPALWGVMNIINVAHGSFIMVGAYPSYTLFAVFGLDPFLSIPLVMAALFLLAGATAMAVGTLSFGNPLAMREVIAGIRGYLAANGFGSVREIVGTGHREGA